MRQVWYNTPTCTPTHNHAPTLTLAIVITLTTDSVQLQCYFVGRFTGSLRSPQPTHGGEPSGLLDYRITVWDSHPRCCHRRIVRMSPRGQARPDVPGVSVSPRATTWATVHRRTWQRTRTAQKIRAGQSAPGRFPGGGCHGVSIEHIPSHGGGGPGHGLDELRRLLC